MVVPKRSNLINNLLLNYLKPATCFNLIIAFVYPFCNVVYLGIRFCLHLNPFCNNNASKEYDCKAFTFLPFTFIMWYITDYIARRGFLWKKNIKSFCWVAENWSENSPTHFPTFFALIWTRILRNNTTSDKN